MGYIEMICLVLVAQIWVAVHETGCSQCNARNRWIVHAGTNGTGSCSQRGPRTPTHVNCFEQSTPQPSGGSQLVATQRCQGKTTDDNPQPPLVFALKELWSFPNKHKQLLISAYLQHDARLYCSHYLEQRPKLIFLTIQTDIKVH